MNASRGVYGGDESRARPNEASGVVQGRIVDTQGRPVSGLWVKLYDADCVGSDDLLTDGHTDKNGKYQLRYGAGPWDCCQGLREGSPDIYAQVWRQSAGAGGQWRLVARSRVLDNTRPSAHLPIDFELSERALTR